MGDSVTWAEAVIGDTYDAEHYCDDAGSCVDDCGYCAGFHCVYDDCREYGDEDVD